MIKQFSVFLFIFIAVRVSVAQNCILYFPISPDAILTYENINPKGKVVSTAVRKLKNMNEENGAFVMTVQTTVEDSKGRTVYDNTAKMRCADGTFYISMRDFIDREVYELIEGEQPKYKDTWLEMPSEMNPGDELSDGTLNIIIPTKKGVEKYSIRVFKRKVEAIEPVETKAGTFDCVKITYVLVINSYDTYRMKVTEWYTEDFGLIKSEYRSIQGDNLGETVLVRIG